jgi:TaqI-like C-terminal specificity domain
MPQLVRQSLWERTPENVFRLDLTEDRARELESLWDQAVAFGDICRINYGAQVSSAERGGFGRDRYLAKSAEGMADPRKFYEGSEMRPFGMTWGGQWLDWRPEEFYGPRTETLFTSEKLSVRHISGDADTFVAWVDTHGYFTDHGVIHAVPYHIAAVEPSYRVTPEQAERSVNYPLFFLLGVIMSLPVLRYYAELYATGSLQGAFSHVYPNTLKALPIPRLDSPPSDVPPDWRTRIDQALTTRAAARAFPNRREASAVLAAVALHRQELEMGRHKREEDFRAFVVAHQPLWRWPRGQSLENPPDENAFLERMAGNLPTVTSMDALRSEFRRCVGEAQADREEAALLQSALDALAARLFASAR